ncbi:hypothetical protein PAXINDRAFT_155991 [Paxillus involutus ATCC 200175]|uniref:Cell morphogenesis protein C-terminal domain-containing protein n=1 Tax=Paxillus involutus ATCC 200175 TaxID=664439 RepID=A0A0C9SXM2_PAXIN|nr:hypothetical protein PAXINDRAFT_155991 [Paxillus involutus ATCC 200175]
MTAVKTKFASAAKLVTAVIAKVDLDDAEVVKSILIQRPKSWDKMYSLQTCFQSGLHLETTMADAFAALQQLMKATESQLIKIERQVIDRSKESMTVQATVMTGQIMTNSLWQHGDVGSNKCPKIQCLPEVAGPKYASSAQQVLAEYLSQAGYVVFRSHDAELAVTESTRQASWMKGVGG